MFMVIFMSACVGFHVAMMVVQTIDRNWGGVAFSGFWIIVQSLLVYSSVVRFYVELVK